METWQGLQGLDSVTAVLFGRMGSLLSYDSRLRVALGMVLPATGLLGLVAHLGRRGTTLSYFDGRCRSPDLLLRTVLECVERHGEELLSSQEPQQFELSGNVCGFAVGVPQEAEVQFGQVKRGGRDVEVPASYCVGVYDRKTSARRWSRGGEGSVMAEIRFVRQHAYSTLPMLFEVFRQRERRFAPFAAKISGRYWNDSAPAVKNGLRPPWEIGNLPTVTLAFDLRKSTFCMEQAMDLGQFGEWVDELVQILSGVAHLNGGAFDKFTGDGALVHFLESECQTLYSQRATDAAVRCAFDMQRAVEGHLVKLRGLLHFDSRMVGAGVAIDVGDAFWSFDYRDNPLTVGRGVVGACRLSDKVQPQRVLMTNGAYVSLSDAVRSSIDDWRLVDFESKESPKEMGVTVWEFRVPMRASANDPGHSLQEIGEVCQDVYRMSRQRAGGGGIA